jgi:hypothetical protein
VKYFTRERYEAIQRAEGEWDQAADTYRQRLESISGALPPGARRLAEDLLHDARIEAIDRPGPRELRLTLRRGYGPPGTVALHFSGVANATANAADSGEDVLYEEVDVAPAGFVYRALLTRGELAVEAADVEVEELRAPDGDDLTVTATHKCASQPEDDSWAIVRVGTAQSTHFWAPLSGPLEAGETLRDSSHLFDLRIAYCPRCGSKLEG